MLFIRIGKFLATIPSNILSVHLLLLWSQWATWLCTISLKGSVHFSSFSGRWGHGFCSSNWIMAADSSSGLLIHASAFATLNIFFSVALCLLLYFHLSVFYWYDPSNFFLLCFNFLDMTSIKSLNIFDFLCIIHAFLLLYNILK